MGVGVAILWVYVWVWLSFLFEQYLCADEQHMVILTLARGLGQSGSVVCYALDQRILV